MSDVPKARGSWARGPVGMVLAGVLGLFFTVGALFALLQPINTLAYYVGYGDTVQVEVTKSSRGGVSGRGDAGKGRIVGSGREVWLSDVRAGETVTARTKLINIGVRPWVYRNSSEALSDLRWLIGFVILGIPALILDFSIYAIWMQRISSRR